MGDEAPEPAEEEKRLSAVSEKKEQDAEQDKEQAKVLGDANRGCTDIIWVLIYGLHWVVFVSIVFATAPNANPIKLYAPRDYSGYYCGIKDQQPPFTSDYPTLDHTDYPFMLFMMNVSGSIETIAEKLICSRPVENYLDNLPVTLPDGTVVAALTSDQMNAYRCACCSTPCASCASAQTAFFRRLCAVRG
jgi:hypothetical protein